MSDEEWGPWIEHDGATPDAIAGLPNGTRVQTHSVGGLGLLPLNAAHPGFYWRWRTVRCGWFRTELRRVCDDPTYGAIIRYRIRKPRGLTILEGLLTDLPEKVDA